MRYNLYYNEQRVNNYPLKKSEVDKVMKCDEIGVKLGNRKNDIKRVKVHELRIIPCIIID